MSAMEGPADRSIEMSRFAAALAAASPGPWRALQSTGGRFAVETPHSLVEQELSKDHAAYLVAVRTSADELMAMVNDAARHDRKRVRQLAKDYSDASRNASPEWLYVAPRGAGDAWFMHNSASLIGSGQLRKADAGLIVEAPLDRQWHCAPGELPAFAARHGLRVDRLWSCSEMTGDSFYSRQERYSCLLSRPA